MYYAETSMGCALYKARDINAARREALREAGSYCFQSIRKAEKADVEWIRTMGGYIPA